MFTVRPVYKNLALKFLKDNTPTVKTLIGLHVRRGDFLSAISVNEGRVVADKNYIRKSMDFFRGKYKDAFFIILSDDKQWCKNNINGSDVVFSNFTATDRRHDRYESVQPYYNNIGYFWLVGCVACRRHYCLLKRFSKTWIKSG